MSNMVDVLRQRVEELRLHRVQDDQQGWPSVWTDYAEKLEQLILDIIEAVAVIEGSIGHKIVRNSAGTKFVDQWSGTTKDTAENFHQNGGGGAG